MIALYILLGVLAVILCMFVVAVIRTLTLPSKKTEFSLSADAERSRMIAGKLSKMLQYETVSYRGRPDPEKYRGYHKVLEELFPLVFERLEKIEIDGNLILKWKGTDSTLRPLMLISHQDVVAAEGEWKYPPFSGTIAEGKVWGRGAADIKDSACCFYQAVEELLESGYTPKCDIYLGSSCTEEIGGDGAPKMVQWLRDHGIRLYMLCDEGGAIVEEPIGGVKGNFAAIGVYEKGYGDLKFTARSHGGHSSTPPLNTPIARLAKFETAVELKSPFKARFTPAVSAMFENLAPYAESFGLKLVLHNVWFFRPIMKLVMPVLSPEAAAMLRTTMAFTMQKGSEGYNVIPQEAWVTANLRFIPHQGVDESIALITRMAKRYGLETEVVKADSPSTPIDLEGEQFKTVVECIGEQYPGLGIMPYVVTGGTDARYFDSIAEACIRFVPINNGPEQLAGMHGLNENIEVGALPGGVDYYKRLIRRMEKR